MLASAVFAFETTLQPFGLLPLLGGCAAAYLVSSILMRNSIMTEKIARRGIRTPEEYLADSLDQVFVRQIASPKVVTVQSEQTVGQVRAWLAQNVTQIHHTGFPVVDSKGILMGIITRRDVSNPDLDPDGKISNILGGLVRFVYDDCTVRQAADHMVNHSIGRLPVVSRQRPHRLIGIVTRSDILSVFQKRLKEAQLQKPTLGIFKTDRGKKVTNQSA
jgi:CBS domain-containing protein